MAVDLPCVSWPTDKRRRLARTKRFLELWSADAELRRQLEVNYRTAFDQLSVLPTFDEEEMSSLSTFASHLMQGGEKNKHALRAPLIADYLDYKASKHNFAEQARRDAVPEDHKWRVWREQQISRCRFTLSAELNDAIIHAPFAIELGDGCSVGCRFCGVSAPPIQRSCRFDNQNALRFEAILKVLSRLAGKQASRNGFLYWATDPFDNPDYEQFCQVFCNVLDVFPHTTTAQPLKDVPRTKRFLESAALRPYVSNRFSILSFGVLRRLFAAFSPEELLPLELVIHTPESITIKQAAGRAFNGSRSQTNGQPESGQSIACVSGFLINMVNRTIKLISPCPASLAWPNGYRIFASGSFTTVSEFEDVVSDMIQTRMNVSFADESRISLIESACFVPREGGFVISTSTADLECECSPSLVGLTAAIAKGADSNQDLFAEALEKYGLNRASVNTWLEQLYCQGVLQEPSAELIVIS